jgi:hypothetical protein
MFYPWLVDEGGAARTPVEQPGAPFSRNNALPSSVLRFDAVVALDRHHFPSPWSVEEQSDCFGL